MDWPDVTILIVTYDRPQEIRKTITALREHVVYPSLSWHIADDGTSDPDYIPSLLREYKDMKMAFTITARKGWGANVNKALDSIKADYVFLCEDDYVAYRNLDLQSGVALLRKADEIGLVRYDGLSGHWLDLKLREAETANGKVQYLLIDPDSPHLNVYSNRPHLKHRRFHKYYGKYTEGLSLGETESWFAHRVKDRSDGPKICALWDGIANAFDHIGKTRQGTESDPNR